MAKKEKEMSPEDFPKKYWKILESLPEFKDTADSASVEDLKKIVLTSEGHISTLEKEKSADVKLNAAKEIIKELGEPYNSLSKIYVAKLKYAVFLLESKGVKL